MVGLPATAFRLQSRSLIQVSVEHNNVFASGQNADEQVLFDGESTQLAVRYWRRFNDCWQGSIAGSAVHHGGGSFDRAIQNWHDAFGLPNAGREDRAQFELIYAYQQIGGNPLILDHATGGMGDVFITAERYLGCQPDGGLLRTGVKLPLGRPEQFSGTGSADVFVDVQSPVWSTSPVGSSRAGIPPRSWNLRVAASFGVLVPGKASALPPLQPAVLFGAVGSSLTATRHIDLFGQLDWHSPVFDSRLTELGSHAVQLTLGAAITLPGSQTLQLSFAEDIVVDTAPDIAIRIGWQLPL